MGMKLICLTELLLLFATSGAFAKRTRASCAEVRRAFASERIGPLKIVPFYAIRTNNLNICSNEKPTCCTRRMEKRYERAASRNLTETIKIKINSLKSLLKNFLHDFHDDFQRLLRSSKVSLQAKLNSTLANNSILASLQRNKNIFDNISLTRDKQIKEDVYKQLNDLVQDYISVLFASTFTNQVEATPNSEQWNCVLKEIEGISFDQSIVDFMLEKIQNSLNATADLLYGVELGLASLEVSVPSLINANCKDGLLRMQYCSHCYGLTLIKPCKKFCQNVLNGCLVGFSEINRFWKHYVTALIMVLGRMIKSQTDPWTLFTAFTGQSDILEKFEVEKSTIKQIERTCLPTISRGKRSTEIPLENKNIKKKLHKRRRYHRRRNRKANLDLFSKDKIDEALSAQRRMLPPHKMLLWEPPLSSNAKKQESKTEEENRETLLELEPEITLSQPDGSGPRLWLVSQRFKEKLFAAKNFFDDLPNQVCDLHQDFSFGIATFGKCWDGKTIVNNYSVPVLGKKMQNQLSNPEVRVSGLNQNILNTIKMLREAAEYLILKTDVITLPDDLLLPLDDIINTDLPKPPCEDDEDFCAGGVSGSGPIDLDLPKHTNTNLHKHKASQSTQNRKSGRKRKRTKLKNDDRILSEFDVEVLLKEEKPFISSAQGGANNQKKNNPENSSSNIYNFNIITSIIIAHLLIVWTLQILQS